MQHFLLFIIAIFTVFPSFPTMAHLVTSFAPCFILNLQFWDQMLAHPRSFTQAGLQELPATSGGRIQRVAKLQQS